MIFILKCTGAFSILLIILSNEYGVLGRRTDSKILLSVGCKEHYDAKSSCFVPSAAPTQSESLIHRNDVTNVIGLQNLGNTCYLNAQMQCLYHIPYIRNLITSNNVDEISKEAKSFSPAYVGLRQLFTDMQQSQHGRAVAPTALCQLLDIPVYEQQDTQEFFKLLLPALDIPQIMDLYTGTYENYIVALDGSNRERRFLETFLDLSLDIIPLPTNAQSEGPISTSIVASLQEQFNQPELLSIEAGNGWRPSPDAPDKVDAHKGYRLLRNGMPAILQLHLKRFHFDWNTETTNKLNHAVTFPLTLDLTNILSPVDDDDGNRDSDRNNDNCYYELQSVIVHVGEYQSGHYYSYVRPDVRTDNWYRLNDEIHTKVRLNDVFQDAIGGIVPTTHREMTKEINEDSRGSFVSRCLRKLFGMNQNIANGYGYGGPKSNAYVLQYIRRTDLAKLYDVAYD